MIAHTPQRVLVRRDGILFGLAPLTVANAALYFVAAALHLGVRIPLGFATLGVPEPIPLATVAETLIGTGPAASSRSSRQPLAQGG